MKLTNEKRREIYKREGFRCAVCDDTRGLSIHHYILRSQGGSNHVHNLVCLCRNCHMIVHGLVLAGLEHISQEDVEQMIVEYLADEYPGIWNPYRKDSVGASKWEIPWTKEVEWEIPRWTKEVE